MQQISRPWGSRQFVGRPARRLQPGPRILHDGIFRVAHAARIGQQSVMGTPWHHRGVVSHEEFPEVATLGGARAPSMDREVGSLEVGKRADIVLVDSEQLDHVPVYDPLYALAACVIGSDVNTVLVDGEIVLRDRRLTRVDQDEIAALLRRRLPRIMERFDAVLQA